MHRIIKRRHSTLNGALGIRKRNNGVAILLARIVEVHLADLLPGAGRLRGDVRKRSIEFKPQ